MKEFAKMKFYSTVELAEKLDMNIQVLTRKLQSGEIEGYKIGKDWRVEEEAIQNWLDRRSNMRVLTPRQKVIDSFIKYGRLVQLPAQHKKRVYILEFFLQKFDPNRIYTEAEVNVIIQRYYDDFCTIRREFIINKMMTRAAGRYHRNKSYKFAE